MYTYIYIYMYICIYIYIYNDRVASIAPGHCGSAT